MTSTETGQRLHKNLTWRDGFAVAMTTPNGLFVTFGYLIGVIGAWTALAIWAAGTIIAYLQCQIFAETASMFPRDSGGVARYAMEGWKRYFAPLGAIAAFGYWVGWSLSASAVAVAFGELITATWFETVDAGVAVLGNNLGLPHVFAVLGMTAAWAFNYFGMKLGASVNKVLGVLVVAGLVLISIACVFSPQADWTSSNLSWSVEGGWKTIVVAFYATAWVTYGTEITASFAPEYKNTARDTGKALRRASLFMIVVFFLVPLSISGSIGEDEIAANPVTFIVVAFNQNLGGLGWVGTVIIASSIFIAMVSCTADGGRALYGLAQEGMTVKQLDHLNKWGVPGRSLTIDLVINTAIMVLVANPISILLASNLGYLIAITLGLAAFLLLRKDRPNWPRPIRRSNIWVPVAAVLVVFNIFVTAVGLLNPGQLGYGGIRQSIVAICILLLSVVLFVYRRTVQDGQPLAWRIQTESMPSGEDAIALALEMSDVEIDRRGDRDLDDPLVGAGSR